MEALGHLDSPMPGTLHRGNDLVHEAPDTRPAEKLVVGKICARCNNGWMDRLDTSVSDDLLGLACGELRLVDLDSAARFRFARWLLKTACVVRHGSPKDFRHVPADIMASCEIDSFLPRGFIAYACQTAEPTRALSSSSVDAWFVDPDGVHQLAHMPQTQRLKAAFQFDRLIIGCAWVLSYGTPCFKVFPNVYELLFLNNAVVETLAREEAILRAPHLDSDPHAGRAMQTALDCEIRPFMGTWTSPFQRVTRVAT